MLKSKANWKWSKSHDTRSIIEQLLHERGLKTEEEQEHFLHPKLEHIQSPDTFHDIAKAKQRILQAMAEEEKVMIYGDYDADGVTSTALLMTAFMELGVNADYYIPSRFEEGYGLNEMALRSFHQAGYNVVITVDNGIADVYEAKVAKELGIDLIITDHHEMQENLPDAYAIIHPKLSEQYIFKELAGVGVAFQFAHYILEYFPVELLDFVAIGTVADLVPLRGENRIFTYYGLDAITNTLNLGIEALKVSSGITEKVTEQDIAFKLGPRINAVGRLENAMLAVELLLTDDEEIATEIAEEIESLNSERQTIVKDIVKEAEQRVDPNDDVIVLHDAKWHEGVLGIAASRLVRTFDRPVIMLSYKEATHELKGSARSIPAFNLFENGMEIEHLFTSFGGHSQAAGLTFPYDNLHDIKIAFNEQIRAKLTVEEMKQEFNITKELTLDEMTERLVEQINGFSPFGMGNEEPTFILRDVPTQIRQIGQEQNHLKLQFKTEKKIIDAIGFQIGHVAPLLSVDTDLALAGSLQINEWNGNRTVQMLIKDIAVNEWQLFDYRGRKQHKFFTPFITEYNTNTILTNDIAGMQALLGDVDVTYITYDSNMEELDQADILYVCDLPDNLSTLENIVRQVSPNSIHISYHVDESAFLTAMPTREEFKWLYGYAMQHGPVQLKVDLPNIIQSKKWTKEKVIFMLKVFLDLEFITISNDILYVNREAPKQALNNSKTYQQRLEQSNIEQVLYYATNDEIKQWFHPLITEQTVNEEEVMYDL